MATTLNPYLSFRGNAREALEFYHGIFGGEVTTSTFGEFGQADSPTADQLMHGSLTTSDGLTLMAADTPPEMPLNVGDNISVSLSGDTDELRGYFSGLSEGGTVTVPLEKQMWGDEFGMCVDKFGINWMVNIAGSTD